MKTLANNDWRRCLRGGGSGVQLHYTVPFASVRIKLHTYQHGLAYK